ncbi:MAG: hypothetical protein IK997_02590 [Bacilli bacterium]|nr:hypothetical protein [Bacilli bacterium]
MKRTIKIVILTVALIASIIIGLYLYKNELQTYALIAAAVGLILVITLITYIFNTRNEEAIYNSTLKKVLNNYDAILVESHNFPDLKGKNIIKVTNMDDLVDAQIEIRKPIYYMIEGEDSCSFVLLDNSEACIYILKQNENVTSPLELIINEYEKHNDIDASLLEDIERTTIIKLNNMKSFKVSPYKKNKDNVNNESVENKDENVKTLEEIKEKIDKQEEKSQKAPEKEDKKEKVVIKEETKKDNDIELL